MAFRGRLTNTIEHAEGSLAEQTVQLWMRWSNIYKTNRKTKAKDKINNTTTKNKRWKLENLKTQEELFTAASWVTAMRRPAKCIIPQHKDTEGWQRNRKLDWSINIQSKNLEVSSEVDKGYELCTGVFS